MKKTFQILLAFIALFFVSNNANSQTTPEFFVGKWSVVVSGTPNGDSKMMVNLVSENGKLTGNIDAGMGEPVKLSNVEHSGNTVTLYFSAGGYDINLTLEKKDENHVAGSMMGMFDAKGERITNGGVASTDAQSGIAPASDFFVGRWNLLVSGTPSGDIKAIAKLERKDGRLQGLLNVEGLAELKEPINFTSVDEKDNSITMNFMVSGYNVYIRLDKKDDNHVTGTELDMYDVKGERITDQEKKSL